jgi:hypothetical protein
MRRISVILLIALAASLAGLAGADAASADTGLWTQPGGANVGGNLGAATSDEVSKLQPWFPNPSAAGSYNYYRSSTPAVSSAAAPEITNFGCNYPMYDATYQTQPVNGVIPGAPVPSNVIDKVRNILTDVRDAYNTGGSSAMIGKLAGAKPGGNDSTSAGVRSLLNWQSTDPTNLMPTMPAGCAVEDWNNLPTLDKVFSFHELLRHTGTWVTSLWLWPGGTVGEFAYNLVEPRAFAYSFWTPHSERGDYLFFDSGFSCNGVTNTTLDKNGKVTTTTSGSTGTNKTCQSGQPLGFNADHLDPGSSIPFWMRFSILFQWLLGCAYFVIIAGGSLMYMARADHKSHFTIVSMMPWLIVSILLTVGINYLIGMVISLSNYLVQMLFQIGDSGSVRGIHEVLYGVGNILSTGNSFPTAVLQLMVLWAAIYYFVRFVMFAIWRQLALVILITISPFACFCLIHPNMRPMFGRWVRAMAALVAAPFVMALILKLGLSFNPAVNHFETGGSGNSVLDPSHYVDNFTSGLMGALMLMVTFHFMVRVPKLAKAIVMNKPVGSGALGKLGGISKFAGSVAMPVNPALGAVLMGGGAALGAAGNAGAGINRGMARLIPDSKMRAGITQGQKKSGLLQRALQSDEISEFGTARGMRALESGSERMTGGSNVGKALGGTQAAIGAGLMSAFGGNRRSRGHWERMKDARHHRHGVREVDERTARSLLRRQEEHMERARFLFESEPKNAGKTFDEANWFETYLRRGGPRVAKAGYAGFEKWYRSDIWSPVPAMLTQERQAPPINSNISVTNIHAPAPPGSPVHGPGGPVMPSTAPVGTWTPSGGPADSIDEMRRSVSDIQAGNIGQGVRLEDLTADSLQYELMDMAVRSGDPLTREEIADHFRQSPNPTYKRHAEEIADTMFSDLISRGILDENGIARSHEIGLAAEGLKKNRVRAAEQGRLHEDNDGSLYETLISPE